MDKNTEGCKVKTIFEYCLDATKILHQRVTKNEIVKSDHNILSEGTLTTGHKRHDPREGIFISFLSG